MTQQWKLIPEAPSYEVSSAGAIRRAVSRTSGKSGRLLKPRYVQGYRTACLCVDGKPKYFRVHRLVLSAFVGQLTLEVNHKNGVRDDNRLENLEYCTPKENILHSIEALGHSHVGDRNPNAKLSSMQIEKIRDLHQRGLQQIEIAKVFGVSKATVCRIVNGKMWAHV